MTQSIGVMGIHQNIIGVITSQNYFCLSSNLIPFSEIKKAYLLTFDAMADKWVLIMEILFLKT
jgi:hypothetical protein